MENGRLVSKNWDTQTHSREFFLSSKRRHTKWTGDWSSDVCSSNLVQSRALSTRRQNGGDVLGEMGTATRSGAEPEGTPRSEERRVGKECRFRWEGERWNEETE